MRTDEDLYSILTFITLGMAIPVLLAIRFYDVLELYLSGSQFTYLVATVYSLVVWFVVARYDLDRINVATASIIFPVVGVVILLFVAVATHGLNDGFRFLFQDVDDLARYAASFAIAGIGAVALQWKTEQLAVEYDRVPAPRIVPLSILVLLALGLLVGGGLGHLDARSATITAVEPDVTSRERVVLSVSVDGEPTELRLRATAPDGSTTIHRITPDAFQDGTATVPIPFWEFDGSSPQEGAYRVTVTGISGATVDTASYTLETAPTPRLVGVETAEPGEAFDLDLPEDARVYRPSNDVQTRVAIVLENQGDVAAPFYTEVLVRDDRIKSRDVFLLPGQQGATIFRIPDDDVERIHAAENGSLTVQIHYDDDRIVTTVDIPAP